MTEERARLFVAVELPQSARSALGDWVTEVLRGRPGLRALAPEALHATLCFLGWRPVSEIEEIAAACEVLAGGDLLGLSLGQGIWLPPRRPRVLAVELEDLHRTLSRVQSQLSETLRTGGWYVPERRPFLAHVTVARVAKGARIRRQDLPPHPPISVVGSTVTLYRSRLGRDGARYEPLSSVALDPRATISRRGASRAPVP